MHFYLVAILGSSQPNLTYQSESSFETGEVVEVPLKNKSVKSVVLKEVDQPEFICREAVSLGMYFGEETMEPARFISEYYRCALGESLALFHPVPIEAQKQSDPVMCETKITLSPEQSRVFDQIMRQPVSLLFGDTGSGKTEIYIKAIEETINAGKTALLLIPEIGLTPQMERRLKKHFGNIVAIWHSRITKKKKESVLAGILEGSVRIVAGARSCLFLPMPALGIVVVDEEHDDSYKAQNRPRYHARDLALYLARKREARVILGSATPSATSFHKFPVVRLKGGYYSSTKSFQFIEGLEEMTPLILEAIRTNLEKAGQVIVFLPTRANYKYLICDSCGKSVECPYCSVSMSLHTQNRAIKCHYCGYMESIPSDCPHCRSGILTNQRIGTAELAAQLSATFPEHTVGKFDRDEVTSETRLKKILKSFNDGEIDILVGTQMLSKGHDYHGVNLAVVLGLDYTLNQSDYRARERAVALLLQIAGRSGRKEDGHVIVQTRHTELFQGYLDRFEALLEDEIAMREGMYPPHQVLATILFSDKNENRARESMECVRSELGRFENIEVVGAEKSAIEKIAGKYRYLILLRSASHKSLLKALHGCDLKGGEVDVNPTQFY